MSSVTLLILYLHVPGASHVLSVLLLSLAEQVEAWESQEQKVIRLTMELETAVSDRNSLKKNYQMAGTEMERMRVELAQTKAK